jgi:NAD(P)-dependent dehydrogenase (short-subunit alcohol dehydrogenase family)
MAQKVALITGCSSGVGLALAVQLAQAGFKAYATMVCRFFIHFWSSFFSGKKL